MLLDVEASKSHVIIYFHIMAGSTTAFFVIVSEIVACFSRGSSTPNTATINTIPFLTLNTSLALTMVVNIILGFLFGIPLSKGTQSSLILASLVVTNKNVRKHVKHRFRQKLAFLFIRTSSSIEPVIFFVSTRDNHGN